MMRVFDATRKPMPLPATLRIGLISDTHGLLRPEAAAALRGSDRIVHAGDIGRPEVLAALAAIAPVTAVRGNVDCGEWAAGLPWTATLRVGEARIHVVHDLAALDLDPAAAGLHAVVAGHSHRPSVTSRGGVLYVNPGSAGPRRFRLPVALGRLQVCGARVTAELIELAPAPRAA